MVPPRQEPTRIADLGPDISVESFGFSPGTTAATRRLTYAAQRQDVSSLMLVDLGNQRRPRDSAPQQPLSRRREATGSTPSAQKRPREDRFRAFDGESQGRPPNRRRGYCGAELPGILTGSNLEAPAAYLDLQVMPPFS